MRRNALPPNDIQHMKFKANASFFADSGVVPFREGWRPVASGTPTLTEWPVPFFFLFLVFGHSVRVGVPCFTDFDQKSMIFGSGPLPATCSHRLRRSKSLLFKRILIQNGTGHSVRVGVP